MAYDTITKQDQKGFTTSGGISVAGKNGVAGTDGSDQGGGGGGGGGSGVSLIVANTEFA